MSHHEPPRRGRRPKPQVYEVRALDVPFDIPFACLRALYCRLSDRNDDPDSVSIPEQIDAGTAYAARRDLVINVVYIDWRTGRDPDRVALSLLAEDAKNGKHPGVVFYDETRLHRELVGAFPVITLHHQKPDYLFESTDGDYDIEEIGQRSERAGKELRNTRRRSMEQRRKRTQRGQWVAGMKPYWLDRDRRTRQPVVAEDRKQAFLEALMIYAAPTGSAKAAAAHLSQNGPLDPRLNASPDWTTQRFKNLLRNPYLWGDGSYARGQNVTERIEGRWAPVIHKRVANPHAVPFEVPALVHQNDLERTECQLRGGCEIDQYPTGEALDALIASRDGKAGGRPYEIEHPLRHTNLMCSCGWRVRWNVQKKYLYVTCAARVARGRSALKHQSCGMQTMPVDDHSGRRPQGGGKQSRTGAVWPKVRRALIEALSDPDALVEQQRQLVLAEQEVQARTEAEEAQLLASLDQTLQALDDQDDRVYRRLDDNEVSPPVYQREVARIDNARRVAEAKKRQILAQRLIVQRADVVGARLSMVLQKFDNVSLYTDQEWSEILPDLVESIVLDLDGNPTIVWRRV
jgi:DNA invertase Pin-like site-specific DNA recombinase